jgi:hypothetical protein
MSSLGKFARCNAPALALFALCAGLQFIRAVIWEHAQYGPFCFLDEFLYRQNAEGLFHGASYPSFHYPPLYPLLLSLGFWWGDRWYEGMLFVNAVISATVVFPAWWTARTFVTVRESVLVVAILLALPLGFVYPVMIMSENLFAPLLFVAIYVGLCTKLGKPRNSYLFGLSLAALWATRYIAVVVLPMFVALWFWKTLRTRDGGWSWASPVAFLGGFVSVLVPWIAYGFYSSASLRTILFGSYSLTKTSPLATLPDLFTWLAAYGAYFVLAIAPVLPWILLVMIRRDSRVDTARLRSLVLFAVLVAGGLLAASTYHSWRHAYNYPEPSHILGRYLTIIVPVLFCCGVIALLLVTRRENGRLPLQILLTIAVSIGVVLLSQGILFAGFLREYPAYFARNSFDSPDLWGRTSPWMVAFILASTAVPVVLLVGGRIGEHLTRGIWTAVTLTLLLIAGLSLIHEVDRWGAIGRHGRAVAQVWKRTSAVASKRAAVLDELPRSQGTAQRLAWGARFFGLPGSIPVTDRRDCVVATSDLVIEISSHAPSQPPELDYRISGQPFNVSLMAPESARQNPCVLSWGPRSTRATVAFNERSNGKAAMWMKGRNFNAQTLVSFADTVIHPSVQDDALTFLVPSRLYAKPGRYEIFLFQKDAALRSDPVWFEVEPESGEDGRPSNSSPTQTDKAP